VLAKPLHVVPVLHIINIGPIPGGDVGIYRPNEEFSFCSRLRPPTKN